MQKIGILLPRSTYYDSIGFDLYQGLKNGLKQIGREDILIVSENIGFGAEKNSTYRSAERLLLDENIGIVFAYITQRSAQLLRPLFMSANRLLIVLDAGVNLPQEWPHSPNILFHSLHNCLGAWLSGQMAVADGYSEGAMVTGYYDGGYLHTAAITHGFQKNGGTLIFNHATGYLPEDFSMAPLLEKRSDDSNSCLLSLFSGDFNEWFFKDLKKIYPDNCPPVYAAPFGLEETMLQKTVFPGNQIAGIAAWSSSLKNSENALFCEKMIESGHTPNLFSLLGWEAATLSVLAIDAMKQCNNNGRNASEKLLKKTFVSPRGTIQFHEASKCTVSPMFKAKIIDDGSGYCKLTVENELSDIVDTYEEMITLDLDGAISGWYNSYTCN